MTTKRYLTKKLSEPLNYNNRPETNQILSIKLNTNVWEEKYLDHYNGTDINYDNGGEEIIWREINERALPYFEESWKNSEERDISILEEMESVFDKWVVKITDEVAGCGDTVISEEEDYCGRCKECPYKEFEGTGTCKKCHIQVNSRH